MSSSSLCAACGLCCNGSFFARITLRDDEPSRLQRRGLPVVQREERQILELPCPKHTGSACSIYEDRPSACVAYRCRLLRNVEERNIAFDDALVKINRLRALRTTIWAALPRMDTEKSVFAAAERFFDEGAGADWRKQHAGLMLDMATFLAISRNDFGVATEP